MSRRNSRVCPRTRSRLAFCGDADVDQAQGARGLSKLVFAILAMPPIINDVKVQATMVNTRRAGCENSLGRDSSYKWHCRRASSLSLCLTAQLLAAML